MSRLPTLIERILPSLIRDNNLGLPMPSIFAAFGMDTLIRGVASIGFGSDFGGVALTGMAIPVLVLRGMVIMAVPPFPQE
jgi:hypothetical protein